MKTRKTNVLLLAGGIAVCGLAETDPLDKALEAQRQQAQRRVYSQKAELDSSVDIRLPQDRTREDQLLDQRLRAIEADLDERARQSAAVSSAQPRPPQAVTPARPDPARNWLTPAILDESASLNIAEAEPDPFQTGFQIREEDREERTARLFGPATVPGPADENVSRFAPGPTELVPRRTLDPLARDSDRGRDTRSTALPMAASAQPRHDPISVLRREPDPRAPSAAARWTVPSASSTDPARPATPAEQWARPFQPQVEQPDAPTAPPPRPIDTMRRSLPGYGSDPFSSERVPGRKSSIWE